MPPATPGLVLVGAMLVVPQFTLIHPYLHLLIIAPLLVWTGCQNALVEAQKSLVHALQRLAKHRLRVRNIRWRLSAAQEAAVGR